MPILAPAFCGVWILFPSDSWEVYDDVNSQLRHPKKMMYILIDINKILKFKRKPSLTKYELSRYKELLSRK